MPYETEDPEDDPTVVIVSGTVGLVYAGGKVVNTAAGKYVYSPQTRRWEFFPSNPPNTADAVGGGLNLSRNGNTTVGYLSLDGVAPFHAFRATDSGGFLDLGTLDPANNATRASAAYAVSNDGSVIVGWSFTATNGIHAFRWTQADGMVDLGAGGTPAEFFLSRAYGLSGDGTVVVGESQFLGTGGSRRAFRWTQESGFQNLGDETREANAITPDGAVVVGRGSVDAFRWTAAGGTQSLGVLPGHQYSAATAVSDDGSIVVGISSTEPIDRQGFASTHRFTQNADNTRAFRWTAQTGMQDLNQLLTAAGAGVPGTTMVAAMGISPLGKWIVGAAITPQSRTDTSVPVLASLTYTPPPETSRLLNLSTRALCQTGDTALIPGFVINGTANKRLLIRAVGPTLGKHPFNLAGVLANPRMTLKKFNATATPQRYDDIANNDDWATNTNAAAITQTASDLSAFAFNDDREAALLMDLAPGQYTVVADGVSAATGIAIVELYDDDTASVDSRLINISNRGFCGIGDQVMIPGFVVSSESPRTVLIRVVGPTLGGDPFNVPGTMTDPKLELYRREAAGTETLVATQDNWGEAANATQTAQIAAQVSAFALTAGSKDAAFVVTLTPGSYTVIGSSAVANGTGVVLVEVYVVP